MKSKFKKKVIMRPAFDKRSPDPKKDYGIHGADLIFHLIGEKGAVSLVIYTRWNLPHVEIERSLNHDHLFCKPMPADIGYHSSKPMFGGQKKREEKCDILNMDYCYSHGSSSSAKEFFDCLVSKGTKGLWKKMKAYYLTIFEGK